MDHECTLYLRLQLSVRVFVEAPTAKLCVVMVKMAGMI